MRLTSDLTIDLDEANGISQFAISLLSTTLDGNGHTVTINLTMGSSANNSVRLGLVDTIAPSGILRNMKVIVKHTQNGNNAFGTLFIGTNQGVVEDIEYSFVFVSCYWFHWPVVWVLTATSHSVWAPSVACLLAPSPCFSSFPRCLSSFRR